jgi:hypothetical protein
VLGVDADFAAVAPLNLAIDGLDGVDKGSEERRFPLPVVADDRGALLMVDFKLNASSHGATIVANRQLVAADTGALTRFDLWWPNMGRRQISFDFFQRKSIQLLLL